MQEAVLLKKVLAASYTNWCTVRNGGPNGVRPTVALMPRCAGTQGDAFSFVEKGAVTPRMQHQALDIGKDNHTVASPNLVVKKVYDWLRMCKQLGVSMQNLVEVAATDWVWHRVVCKRKQTSVKTALPRLR
ncbi:hypothetical protein Tamer19_70010 [Cupriavidus sp. TA19]|nr:hypothetical protein Tamer19_70010 [Cupriavidus sp. TA19]